FSPGAIGTISYVKYDIYASGVTPRPPGLVGKGLAAEPLSRALASTWTEATGLAGPWRPLPGRGVAPRGFEPRLPTPESGSVPNSVTRGSDCSTATYPVLKR